MFSWSGSCGDDVVILGWAPPAGSMRSCKGHILPGAPSESLLTSSLLLPKRSWLLTRALGIPAFDTAGASACKWWLSFFLPKHTHTHTVLSSWALQLGVVPNLFRGTPWPYLCAHIYMIFSLSFLGVSGRGMNSFMHLIPSFYK